MSCTRLALFAFPIAALLAGCASQPAGPLSLSLNDLGSEVKVDAGSLFGGLSHRRSHNVTGMGASDTLGELTADPDPPLLFAIPNLFSRENLPDQLALRISPQCSQVVVQDLAGDGSKVSAADVLALRDQLQGLELSELALLKHKTEQALLQEIIAAFPVAEAAGSAPPAASAAATPSSGPAVTSAALPEAAPAAAAATPEAAAAPAASAAAPTANPKAAASAAADADLQDARIAAWRRLHPQLPVPNARAAWQARAEVVAKLVHQAEEAAALAAQDAAKLRAKPGLVVARWDHAKARRSVWEAIGLAFSRASEQRRAGFVVLGAPRTMTLAVGDDLLARACRVDGASCQDATASGATTAPARRTGMDSAVSPGRLYTTSYQLLARHVAWAESGAFAEEQAFSLKLDELIAGLSGAASGLTAKLTALKIVHTQAQQMRATAHNAGAISAGPTETHPFSFDGDEQYRQSIDHTRRLRSGWLTVSSMRSTLDDYARGARAVRSPEPMECRDRWIKFAAQRGIGSTLELQAGARGQP